MRDMRIVGLSDEDPVSVKPILQAVNMTRNDKIMIVDPLFRTVIPFYLQITGLIKLIPIR